MDLPRDAVLERIGRANPRVVVVVAGPGWGKSFLGKELVKAAAPDSVIVVDDVHENKPGEAERIAELLRTLSPDRRLVLLSRDPIALELSRYVAPHEVLTLKRVDITLTRDECRKTLSVEELPRDLMEYALDLAGGWPIATLLMGRLARDNRLGASLQDLASDEWADLHEYIRTHMLPRLTEQEALVLAACSAIHNAAVEDITAALDFDVEPVLRGLLRRRLKYFQLDDGVYSLQPMIVAMIRAQDPERIQRLLRAAAAVHRQSGNYVQSATMALAAGDLQDACDTLDLAGSHDPGESMNARYFAVADGLPLELLCASKHVFTEYFGSRTTRSRPRELYERVVQLCEQLTPDAPAFVRYSARVALFIALRSAFKTREGYVVAQECLALAKNFPEARARNGLLVADYACLLCSLGKVEQAERLWQEIRKDDPSGTTYFQMQDMNLRMNAHLYRGEISKISETIALEQETATRWNDPTIVGYVEATRSLFSAVFDPHSSITEQFARIDRTNVRSRLFADAFRAFELEDPFPTHPACLLAIDAALGQTDVGVARRLVERACAGFDRMAQPYWQILGRLILARIPGTNVKRILAECAELAADVEVPAIASQVRAIAEGKDVSGSYSAVLERVRISPLLRGALTLRISVINACVTRGKQLVPVRQRELEVAIVLALAGAPVSVEAICGRVWPQANEEAALSALRMSVHRLRKQLGDNGAVRNVSAGYQLSPDVGVDLIEVERLVSAMRRLPELSAADYARLCSLFDELVATRSLSQSFPWFDSVDMRLQTLRHAAGALIARHDVAKGQPLLALERANALLRFDPLDEPAVELAVRSCWPRENAPRPRTGGAPTPNG